uniref:Uncharacterized protein n=1 Tax=Romanomermis culicivorax TaxID=13658 RepID=A0A915IMZ6_ROMCU
MQRSYKTTRSSPFYRLNFNHYTTEEKIVVAFLTILNCYRGPSPFNDEVPDELTIEKDFSEHNSSSKFLPLLEFDVVELDDCLTSEKCELNKHLNSQNPENITFSENIQNHILLPFNCKISLADTTSVASSLNDKTSGGVGTSDETRRIFCSNSSFSKTTAAIFSSKLANLT